MSLKSQFTDVRNSLQTCLEAASALVVKLQHCVLIGDLKFTWIAENDALVNAISGISSAISSISYPEVTIDEAVYQLVLPEINYNGEILSAEDIADGDGSIAAALLAEDSGMIKRKLAASFTANSWVGSAPFTIEFTDESAGEVESWFWEFGDGGTSTLQNPSHEYTDNSAHQVTLTITNKYGTDITTNWIND